MNFPPSAPTTPALRALFQADGLRRPPRHPQYRLLGFFAGFAAMVAGTGLWVLLAAAAGTACNWLAPVLGLLVGGVVSFFGYGSGRWFAAVAVASTAAGCLLGPLCIRGLALARLQGTTFWASLLELPPRAAVLELWRSTPPLDGVWFALALGLAGLLALRRRASAPA